MKDHYQPIVNPTIISILVSEIQQILGDQCTVDLDSQYRGLIALGHLTEEEAIKLLKEHLALLQLETVLSPLDRLSTAKVSNAATAGNCLTKKVVPFDDGTSNP